MRPHVAVTDVSFCPHFLFFVNINSTALVQMGLMLIHSFNYFGCSSLLAVNLGSWF